MYIRDLITLFRGRPRRTYLDYAAATPVAPEVKQAMAPYFDKLWANPSAIHREGRYARAAIDRARKSIAMVLSIRERDVVFTGNGTEANNLALYGTVRELHEREHVPYHDIEIISTKLEHPSVGEVLNDLATKGVTITYVPVTETGLIDEGAFEGLLNPKVRLVTFAYVNSEIGVVQRVKHLTRVIRKFNQANNTTIRTHLDACQAPLWLPCGLDQLGVDMLSLDAGKCYGPKGVGVLAFRHDVSLEGVLLGGGQERGLRAGTESTALVVGCAVSLERAQNSWKERKNRTEELRNLMITVIHESIEGAVLNGPRDERVANNINISIPGIDSEYAVVVLDAKGIAASTKSACKGSDSSGSVVVQEISGDAARANSTIRFTLGEATTRAEVLHTVSVLKEHVEKMRRNT